MTAHYTFTLGLAASIGLLALGSCREDGDPTGGPVSSGTTTGAATSTADAPVADSSGGAPGSACIDDYHGNQSHEAALDLVLDTTDTAVVVLGDGLAADPPEVGDDELAVCDAAPSDFFTFTAQCPGYLSVEARDLAGGVPELLLYDESIAQGDPPLEQALGDWYGFFLKPIQRRLDDDSYVIEVRHVGGASQRYSLAVAWLPETLCPA
jgi:hypothetical protein